jgi:hypothetical protein
VLHSLAHAIDRASAALTARASRSSLKTDAARLTTKTRDHGHRSGARSVHRPRTWRDGAIKPAAMTAVASKPREVTGRIVRPAAERTEPEGFAAGTVKDYDAVRNDPSLPRSSGAVESNVCKP